MKSPVTKKKTKTILCVLENVPSKDKVTVMQGFLTAEYLLGMNKVAQQFNQILKGRKRKNNAN